MVSVLVGVVLPLGLRREEVEFLQRLQLLVLVVVRLVAVLQPVPVGILGQDAVMLKDLAGIQPLRLVVPMVVLLQVVVTTISR